MSYFVIRKLHFLFFSPRACLRQSKSENTEISLKPHLFNLGPIPNWTTSGSMNGLNMEPVLCNWKKSIPKSNISKKVRE